jgi:hypothetical protein
MYSGKTLFAQVMDFLPWSSFERIVQRYGGDHRVRTLRCAEQFRVMAFAQLTYRESLRDIEVRLGAQANKLYHMGFREPVRRATLADANEVRNWRIYADFAHGLITRARALYAGDNFGVELDNTVYALDATTIDLCLALFPWAPYQQSKAAVKLHTLLDLRGSIPAFLHISDSKLYEAKVLDLLILEAGALYIMDRGYHDFERLHRLELCGAFFVTRARANTQVKRLTSQPVDRSSGVICDQRIQFSHNRAKNRYPAQLRRIRLKDPSSKRPWCFSPITAGVDDLYPLQDALAGGAVLQMDQATPAHQALLRHLRECGENSDLDRHRKLESFLVASSRN